MFTFLRRPRRAASSRPRRCRLALERLEDRLVPYSLSGYTWANPNVSVSFMPDGTMISSTYPSNLFAVYNAAYPQATWQREVARALQSWANQTNLNFHFVADDGSPQGTPGLAQGDSRFGDIRIGGFNIGSGILGIGWNPGNTTTAGDVELNTSSAFPIGSIPDLASVVMHEAGHAIGFNHSLVDPAVMEGGLWGTYPGPYADDIAGLVAMYGTRRADAFDASAPNNTLATATTLTPSYGAINVSADITTMADVDYYKMTAPAGTDGTLTVSVDARNLSLFDPKVAVYNSSGTLLATASATTYGGVATVSLTGLVAGQTYYVMAAGATSDVFGMGAYKLTAQFGGFSPPAINPDSCETNDTLATATGLGTLTSLSKTGLTLHTSTDVDDYTFVAGSKGTYTVSITPTQGSGGLSLTVFNAGQAALTSGQSLAGGDTLSLSLAAGQRYYVKVFSPTGGLLAYNLTIAKAGGGGGGGGGKHLVFGVGSPDDQAHGDVFYRHAADDPDQVRSAPIRPAAGSSHHQLMNPAFAAAAFANPASIDGALTPAQVRAVSLRDPAGDLPNVGPQAAPLVSAATTALADMPTVSGLLSDSGNRASPTNSASNAEEAAGAVSTPAGAPVDPEETASVGVELQQPRDEGCFAVGSKTGDAAECDTSADEFTAQGSSRADALTMMVLAVALGGCLHAYRKESEPRKRPVLGT